MTDNDDIIIRTVAKYIGMVNALTNRMDTCILSTRVGLAVFRHFGINAKPVPVIAMAFNASMIEHLAATDGHPGPESEWPDDAWSVGVGAGFPEGQEPTGWDGHLVIHLPDHGKVFDPTAGQLARPDRNIQVDRTMIMDVPIPWPNDHVIVLQEPTDGTVIRYERTHDRSYTTAHDWRTQDSFNRTVVAAIIRSVREAITKSEGAMQGA